jgi:hypothetical protein
VIAVHPYNMKLIARKCGAQEGCVVVGMKDDPFSRKESAISRL